MAIIGVAEVDARSADDGNGLPLVYDHVAIEKYWSEHHCIVACRIGTILRKILPFLASSLWQFKFGDQTDESDSRWGADLREVLTVLGPTFIKFGQMLSIRPDMFRAPVLVELQKLCDAVPAFPTEEAIALIEQELGGPIESFFEDLDVHTQPVAAASLGQVYKCTVKASPEGEWRGRQVVAMKVQRPDMVRSVSLDLYIARQYMGVVEWVKGQIMQAGLLAERKQFDVDMFDTLASASFLELDYENEARNQTFFKEAFAERGLTKVFVPAVHDRLTTRRVLVTEWVEGKQLSKSSPEVIQRLVPVGVECFLVQLLDIGFFHSDPHPGNLMVNERGQLALIDFGLCATIDKMDTVGMTGAIVHLMQGDVRALVDDAVSLGFLPASVERTELLPVLERLFEGAQLAVREGAASSSFAFKSHARRHQFKHVSRDLNEIFYRYPFVVPEYFALITRALIVLEGIACVADPQFDIFQAAYPYASYRALKILGWKDLSRITYAVAGVVTRT